MFLDYFPIKTPSMGDFPASTFDYQRISYSYYELAFGFVCKDHIASPLGSIYDELKLDNMWYVMIYLGETVEAGRNQTLVMCKYVYYIYIYILYTPQKMLKVHFHNMLIYFD